MKYLLLIPMLICSGCMIPYSVKIPSCSGTILDYENGKPIESIKVVISDYPETECQTDANGNFQTKPTSYRQVFSFGDRIDHYDLIAGSGEYELITNSVMVFRQDKIQVGEFMLKKKK